MASSPIVRPVRLAVLNPWERFLYLHLFLFSTVVRKTLCIRDNIKITLNNYNTLPYTSLKLILRKDALPNYLIIYIKLIGPN